MGRVRSPCVCALGAGCYRVQSGKKRAALNHSIKVHKKGDDSGQVFNLCDVKELKIHREVYELTASAQEAKSLQNSKSKKHVQVNNKKTSLANAKAKEAGKTEAQRRGISVALTGTQFKEKWLQGMYLHSQGPNRTHAQATLDFMAGKRVGYIFAQGGYRKRLEKAGIFQPRGEKKTPPVVIKRSGMNLGASDVEDKFYELLMHECNNGYNVRGVEKAGTSFCGIGEGFDRTNTTVLNHNAGGGGQDPCSGGIGQVWLCIAKKQGDIQASGLQINPCYADDPVKNRVGTAQDGTIMPGVDDFLKDLMGP